MSTQVDNDIHPIQAEECKDPVEVQRIDDEEGTLVALTKNLEGDGEDDDDGFSVYFSLENARKLGQLLLTLTDAP
jgi:hypothetical protein